MARSLLAISILLLSSLAIAQEEGFRYSYLQVSYSRADYDGFAGNADGFGFDASVAISDEFHLFGGYRTTEFNNSVDADGWNAGVGFNTPISPNMDAVFRASYVSTEIGPFDDDGFAIGAGVRVAASEAIELDLGLSYVDTDSGSDTSVDAGFLFNFDESFAVGVSGSWDDDVSVWSLNGRLYFE